MAVWDVLAEQVTLKHFLMKVIYEHDKTFKWEYYMKNKCFSYPSSKLTTLKFVVFSRKCFMKYHIALSVCAY